MFAQGEDEECGTQEDKEFTFLMVSHPPLVVALPTSGPPTTTTTTTHHPSLEQKVDTA